MILNQAGDAVPFLFGSQATNATARAYIDTLNCSDVDIIIGAGKAAATNASATFTSLAIQHSDTTDATNFSTIMSGTTGTPTSSQFSLTVNNDTAVFTAYRATVRKDGRKRYLAVLYQPMTGYNTNYAVAFKSGKRESPSDNGGVLAWGII